MFDLIVPCFSFGFLLVLLAGFIAFLVNLVWNFISDLVIDKK